MTQQLTNSEIAAVFHAIADSMEILGEDRFRIAAYRRGGEALADLPAPLSVYRQRGELAKIPGVGKAIADKVAELLDTGKLQFYEKLRARVPPGVLELLRIPNLGPRSVARLYEERGIASVAALKEAAESGKLAGMKGFGPKSIQDILHGITTLEQQPPLRRLMADGLRAAEQLLAALRAAEPAITEASYAGSLRRGRVTVGDLDLLAASPDPAAAIRAFTTLPLVAELVSGGAEKATVYLHNGLQADLIAVVPERWGSALQHFTGSRAHNIKFRELALARGLSFSEHGFRNADGTLLPSASEAEVYAAVGLPYIPPELREDQGELEAAATGTLPPLVELADLRADLHMHSTWSDGRASVRVMAEAARARGYRHIALTDHGAYLGVTNGLDGARLAQQAEEIAALNAEYAADGVDFRVLRGVEVDITPEGELALPDAVLAKLDLVIASPHVSLSQPTEKATERLLRAIRNPHVDIIGHPTGRLINGRSGSELDLDAIARAAADHGVLLEVNSGPDRLDLEGPAVRRVLELGARITINSDAHHPDHLTWLRLGVQQARRGWATAEQVANTWDMERLLAWVAEA